MAFIEMLETLIGQGIKLYLLFTKGEALVV